VTAHNVFASTGLKPLDKFRADEGACGLLSSLLAAARSKAVIPITNSRHGELFDLFAQRLIELVSARPILQRRPIKGKGCADTPLACMVTFSHIASDAPLHRRL